MKEKKNVTNNRFIFKLTVHKDGQVRVEQQKVSLEEEQLDRLVKILAERLEGQGHSGIIFVSKIRWYKDEEIEEGPICSKEYGKLEES